MCSVLAAHQAEPKVAALPLERNEPEPLSLEDCNSPRLSGVKWALLRDLAFARELDRQW